MDSIVKAYNFERYVATTRGIVICCSSIELLLVLFNWLDNSSLFAKLIHLIFLIASTTVSAHNLFLSIDNRLEVKKVSSTDSEVRNKALLLLLTPTISGIVVFFTVTNHLFFSLLALIHSISALAQLAIEVFEAMGTPISQKTPEPETVRTTAAEPNGGN